ncbi:hypothetical protein PINS_up020418 [Pythium insidiosum]|nr:hypothetical protein PINS_up020418 [Pythium insidiosum]
MVATRVETPAHQPALHFSIMPVNRKKKMCHELKVIALGDARVGKTSLLQELTASNSNNHSNATGLDFRVRLADVGDALVKIQLWDTADQEKYGASALPAAYFRHARAAFLVFDVTDRGSFVNVARWAKQLQSFHDGREFSVVLVANRCEVSSYARVVSASHALRLARALGAKYVECNTRDGTNTEQAFELLTDAMANAQVWRPSIDAIDACVADAASPAARQDQANRRRRDRVVCACADGSTTGPLRAHGVARAPDGDEGVPSDHQTPQPLAASGAGIGLGPSVQSALHESAHGARRHPTGRADQTADAAAAPRRVRGKFSAALRVSCAAADVRVARWRRE